MLEEANLYYLSGEYEKAREAYKRLPYSKDILWQICLCDFGVVFYEHPYFHNSILYCNRLVKKRFEEIEEYKLLMKICDEEEQKEYSKLARQIIEIQENYDLAKQYDILVIGKSRDDLYAKFKDLNVLYINDEYILEQGHTTRLLSSENEYLLYNAMNTCTSIYVTTLGKVGQTVLNRMKLLNITTPVFYEENKDLLFDDMYKSDKDVSNTLFLAYSALTVGNIEESIKLFAEAIKDNRYSIDAYIGLYIASSEYRKSDYFIEQIKYIYNLGYDIHSKYFLSEYFEHLYRLFLIIDAYELIEVLFTMFSGKVDGMCIDLAIEYDNIQVLKLASTYPLNHRWNFKLQEQFIYILERTDNYDLIQYCLDYIEPSTIKGDVLEYVMDHYQDGLLLQLLIDYGFEANTQVSYSDDYEIIHNNLLAKAIQTGMTHLVELVYEDKLMNYYCYDSTGKPITLMALAIQTKQIELVEYLINQNSEYALMDRVEEVIYFNPYGEKVSRKNNIPLLYDAIMVNSLPIVRILLEHGARADDMIFYVERGDLILRDLLSFAILDSKNINIIEALCEYGADFRHTLVKEGIKKVMRKFPFEQFVQMDENFKKRMIECGWQQSRTKAFFTGLFE